MASQINYHLFLYNVLCNLVPTYGCIPLSTSNDIVAYCLVDFRLLAVCVSVLCLVCYGNSEFTCNDLSVIRLFWIINLKFDSLALALSPCSIDVDN